MRNIFTNKINVFADKKRFKQHNINFLKKLVTTDIDESGNEIFVSKDITETVLLENKSNTMRVKLKRILLGLKNNNYITVDNDVIRVTDDGISEFIDCKKNNKILVKFMSLCVVIGIIVSLLITYLVCEITTEGLFLNTYTNTEGTYKFYLSTYSFDGDVDDGVPENGNFEVEKGLISFENSDIELQKYKNFLYYKANRPAHYFECIPCKKIDKNTYSSGKLYESQSAFGIVLDGTYGLDISLHDNGEFVFREDTFGWGLHAVKGKYTQKNDMFIFKVEKTEDLIDDEIYNDEYTMYGVLIDDTLYPNLYKKK